MPRNAGDRDRGIVAHYFADRIRYAIDGVDRQFDLTVEEWRELKTCFGGRCAYCGRVPSGLRRDILVLEHVEPISRGGSHSRENVVPACNRCNVRKSDLPLLEWVCVRERVWRYFRAGRTRKHLTVQP
jgi:5-methylcytosine-specific restriction endonuclease McrA